MKKYGQPPFRSMRCGGRVGRAKPERGSGSSFRVEVSEKQSAGPHGSGWGGVRSAPCEQSLSPELVVELVAIGHAQASLLHVRARTSEVAVHLLETPHEAGKKSESFLVTFQSSARLVIRAIVEFVRSTGAEHDRCLERDDPTDLREQFTPAAAALEAQLRRFHPDLSGRYARCEELVNYITKYYKCQISIDNAV